MVAQPLPTRPLDTEPPALEVRATPTEKPRAYSVPIGYLRTFATLLVLAHHAVLAYHPFAPATVASLVAEPRWWQAFPVQDPQRSTLVGLLVGWNDIVLMALLFLLSGMFVSRSLARKGAGTYLGDRLRRLGLPFLALAAIVTPLAYYPTYLRTADPQGLTGFAREWLALGYWPAGPGWFLWVLLVFGALAAALSKLRPGWEESLGRKLAPLTARPALCFGALVAASALVYVPLAGVVSPMHWTQVGPFAFQTGRLPHYALYFFFGIAVGAWGLDRGLLASDGRLARRWPLWVTASGLAFAFAIVTAIASFDPAASSAVLAAASLGFVASCAASSFALLALFVRFARKPHRLAESLSRNAYGMYVVHYAFASWVMLALLAAPLPALGKATVAVVATVLLSWGATAALRRVPAIRRVL